MALQAGKKAPKFLLQDKDGERHGIETFNTERLVLYFYPKDDTPGCTLEALEFSKRSADFQRRGVAVVGISGGDNRSKSKFCLKHSLSVPLLSDSDFSVSEAYRVYGEKSFMGRSYKGIHRTTFVVNAKTGLIEHVFEGVKPEGHAAEVLAHLSGKTPVSAKSAKPKTAKAGSGAAKKAKSAKVTKKTTLKTSVKSTRPKRKS